MAPLGAAARGKAAAARVVLEKRVTAERVTTDAAVDMDMAAMLSACDSVLLSGRGSVLV